MGAIADDMVMGCVCSYCCIYFEQPHFYSVLCNECWNDAILNKITLNGLQKAIHEEL